MSATNSNLATKRSFWLMLSRDIDAVVQGGMRTDFRGITEVKNFPNYAALSRALAIQIPSLIIIDGIMVENLLDIVKGISASKALYKVLLILPSDSSKEEMKEFLQYSNVVMDIVVRPFTLKRLYSFLSDRFKFTKPRMLSVKEISTETLSEGMILAEDVYAEGGTDPLFDCGTVLDEATIKELIKNNIKNIKAHTETSRFMNCWEVKKCGCENECPAAFFVDADGFLGGINAGRACILLKATIGPCEGNYKNTADKVTHLCQSCDFYKMLQKDDLGKITSADLAQHVEKKKSRARPAPSASEPPAEPAQES